MRQFTTSAIIVFAIILVGASLFARKSNPWDTLLLDVYAQSVANTTDSKALYIAIDDNSVAEFGGWPWPRDIHANLIKALSSASVIVYDIAFVGASAFPNKDAKLEDAVANNPRVVLPLLAERDEATGELATILPYGSLAQNALLGHVDMPVEGDSRLRMVYLKAGNANAQYPLLAYAADIVTASQGRLLRGARPSHERRERGGIWTRDYANLLMPRVDMGAVETISASSVLRGEVSADTFKNRPVFVGIDTESLTKKLTLSGFGGQSYSDAQIQIQIYEAIQQGNLLVPASTLWAFLSALLAVILLAGLARVIGSIRRMLVFGTAVIFVLFVLPLVAAAMGYWVNQGYGLAAAVLLTINHVLQRVDFYKQRSLPVESRSPNYWHTRWGVQVSTAHQKGQCVAVAVIELDYFDRFKLDYSSGHVTNTYYRVRSALQTKVGDAANLMAFEHYQENRWIVLLGGANIEQVNALVQRLSPTVEALQISHQNSTTASVVTVSAGVAASEPGSGRDLVWLLGNADVALMQAIAQGRNHCVVIQ